MSEYRIIEDGRAIKCLRCGMTSWNPGDVAHRYCAACNVFHDHPLPPRLPLFLFSRSTLSFYAIALTGIALNVWAAYRFAAKENNLALAIHCLSLTACLIGTYRFSRAVFKCLRAWRRFRRNYIEAGRAMREPGDHQ